LVEYVTGFDFIAEVSKTLNVGFGKIAKVVTAGV
jgi:hypothetical protein